MRFFWGLGDSQGSGWAGGGGLIIYKSLSGICMSWCTPTVLIFLKVNFVMEHSLLRMAWWVYFSNKFHTFRSCALRGLTSFALLVLRISSEFENGPCPLLGARKIIFDNLTLFLSQFHIVLRYYGKIHIRQF